MLYAVMAEVTNRTADKAVPVAYILMRHQTKQSYTTAFNILKTFFGDRKILVNLDFELAAIQYLEPKYQDAISTM